jgi:hypothetical protein
MRISYDVSVGGEPLGRVCLVLAGDDDAGHEASEAFTLLWGAPPLGHHGPAAPWGHHGAAPLGHHGAARLGHHGLAERLLFELPARAHVEYGTDVLRAVRRPGLGDVARVYNIVRAS